MKGNNLLPTVLSLWEDIVKPRILDQQLTGNGQENFKAAVCQWASISITASLQAMEEDQQMLAGWKVHYQPGDFLGAREFHHVDIWSATQEAGLILAAKALCFHDKNSIRSRWEKELASLVEFSNSLHLRFPVCTIAGIIVVPEWEVDTVLQQHILTRCLNSIERKGAYGSEGLFEALVLATYNRKGDLTWNFDQPNSLLMPEIAFEAIAHTIYLRTIMVA